MDKIKKIARVLERGTNHRLKRKRIIEARLKAFGQKSIPGIFKKSEKPKIEQEIKEIKKINWWRKVVNWFKNIFK